MFNITPEQKIKIYRGLRIAGIVLLVLIVLDCLAESRGDRYDNKQENSITFSGHGEIAAIPDIANISFTIKKEASTVKVAQEGVALVEKKVLDMLKLNNIADKDIKTVSASFNPKYEYRYDLNGKMVPCALSSVYPCPGKNVVVGYEAYESINLKIRNTDDTGKIMQELGTLGVSDLNGPNFTVDNEDGLKVLARKKAIEDAKEKAKSLSKDLGIHLGKITSFSESGNYPVPMYAKGMSLDSSISAAAPAVVPKGENIISSDVSITYEIR
ncbi:MAG: SIMPL domain-containing protein [bacterium]